MRLVNQLQKISPITWALIGGTITLTAALSGCVTGAADSPLGASPGADFVKMLLGNAPGFLAAGGIALRAQSKIRISDAERGRIEASAQHTAVLSMKSSMDGLRADLDLAQGAVTSALTRERMCEDRCRVLDGRCDALAKELHELRVILRAGGLRVSDR